MFIFGLCYYLCRQMATAAERYAGDHCKRLGLSIDQFYSASTRTQTMKIANIKKGPIYELCQVQKSWGTP